MVNFEFKRKNTAAEYAILAGSLFIVVLLSACGSATPPNAILSSINEPNKTGFQADDGKQHTGAGVDHELEKLKRQMIPLQTANETAVQKNIPLESISKSDRDLARRIRSAHIEIRPDHLIRIQVSIADSGLVNFDFSEKEIMTSGPTAGATLPPPGEVRYSTVIGKTADGSKTPFAITMLCQKAKFESGKPAPPGCRTATLELNEIRTSGAPIAKAGLVVRHQETTIIAKTKSKELKNEILKRLVSDFKIAKVGSMQSFEVAWGPSGFTLDIGDKLVCPTGRLVETNDLDEPLKLNCAGIVPFRDLEGRMIGNTTRGELFLEVTAATPGAIWGETIENVYLLIRHKRDATTANPVLPITKSLPAVPVQNSIGPVVDSANEDEIEPDEPIFAEDQAKTENAVQLPPTAGWLIPINPHAPISKVLSSDRKIPSIDSGVKKWINSDRLKNFAIRFLPNRTLVTDRLGASAVPPEFALLMVNESRFFIEDGYPIEAPIGSSAAGPWQMLDQTAINSGLSVFRRGTRSKRDDVNPCDERADLAKSTAAAGRYLRSIIQMFPNDPKLVVLGYNQGEFGVRKSVTNLKTNVSEARLKVIKEVGLGFWAIRRFNMASASGIKYVENFVSLYHASLEMTPVKSTVPVAAWRPNPRCR